MTYDDFEDRVRDGKLPANARIRFEPVTGDVFVPARDLDLYQQLVNSDRGRLRRLLGKRGLPIVTAILVGVQIRIYLWSKVPGAKSWLMENTSNWAPAVLEQGEVYRLFSYGFLHVDAAHLLFNMLFLAYTGANLERAFGRKHLVLLYLVSVFAGGLLSMSLSPDRPSLGASGGDFGLIAASIVFGWKYADLLPPSARKYYGWALFPYLVFALWSGLRSEGVDNWGHVGGLIGGAIVVTLLHPELMERYREHNRRMRRLIAGAMLLLAATIAGFGQSFVPFTAWDHTGLNAARPSYWAEGWSFTGDRAFFSPTRLSTLVVSTSTHSHPEDLETLEGRFIEQVGAGGRELEVLRSNPTTLNDTPAREIELRFRLGDDVQHMRAVIVTRGQMVHRIHLHTLEGWQGRFDTLWQRVLEHADLVTPDELLEAREKVERNPRAWRSATDLAEALGQLGEVDEALENYRRAETLSPSQPRPVIGRVALMHRYDLNGTSEAADDALARFPDAPRVIVTVAEVRRSKGEIERANALLDDAWRRFPGDRVLRQARTNLNLSTELPTVETED
jgi:rhomboid protease GluP